MRWMQQLKKKSRHTHLLWHILCSAGISVFCIVVLLHSISAVSENTAQSYAQSLQAALARSAVHCYAVEGAYPESLDYLQEHYAIHWDTSRYVVDYQIFGSNRMPVITVIPL